MDSIRSYLKDIKTIPLLTAAQEIELAKRIQKGDNKAREQMIVSNLRLVINIAKRYGHLGVPLMDLIEEGNLGLMKAVTKYNPKKGFRFSTYGAWWIRQYITRAIANQGKTVRIPVYMTELLSKFKRVTEELSQKLGRRPTVTELAKKLKVPAERIERMQELVVSSQTTSLETRVGHEGETEMIDLLQDESAADPQEDITRFLQHERIQAMLARMTEREQRVLTLRYGLEDSISRTLGETAKYFSITRERVRQIESGAMAKLRAMIMAEEQGGSAAAALEAYTAQRLTGAPGRKSLEERGAEALKAQDGVDKKARKPKTEDPSKPEPAKAKRAQQVKEVRKAAQPRAAKSAAAKKARGKKVAR